MTNGTTTGGAAGRFHQPERNRYFYAKQMGVQEFELEQHYVRSHRLLHNEMLHGPGVVCGLAVQRIEGSGNETKVVIDPGVAVDCCGRVIMVAQPAEIDLLDLVPLFDEPQKDFYLCIRYDECTREPVRIVADVSTCEEKCDYSRIQENFAFKLLSALPGPVAAEDICSTWMNLNIVSAEVSDEAGEVVGTFERITPLLVKPGEVFTVHRRIKSEVSGIGIEIEDTLPDVFQIIEGSLVLEEVSAIEGKTVYETYLAKVELAGSLLEKFEITGQSRLPAPSDLPVSEIEVIRSANSVEQQIRQRLYEQKFHTCPACVSEEDECIVIAKVRLQKAGAAFIVSAVENAIFDRETENYRQQIYSTRVITELLECVRGLWRQQPFVADVRPTNTGIYRLENIEPGERSISEPITHGLGKGPVEIKLGVEVDENQFIMGDLAPAYYEIKNEEPPSLAAWTNEADGTFQIILTNPSPDRTNYTIRWWATPGKAFG